MTAVGFALAAVYLIWGSTYYAIRIALESMPPFLMAGVRFLIAGAVLVAIGRARRRPWPTKTQLRAAALIGLCLLLGGNGGVVYAEQHLGSGIVALIVATVPLFTGLAGGLFGKWPSGREWAGIGVGLAGVSLLALDGSLRATPTGVLALLVSTNAWAFGSMWSRHLEMPEGLDAPGFEMLAGGAAMLLVGAMRGEHVHVPLARSVFAVVYLIILGSLVGFTAYIYLLEKTRPAVSSSYAYVNPVVAMAIGGFTGEKLKLVDMLALAVVLAGVVLMARATARRSRPSAGELTPPELAPAEVADVANGDGSKPRARR
jgi:drug/metabolite transporter (DMT)-like permease